MKIINTGTREVTNNIGVVVITRKNRGHLSLSYFISHFNDGFIGPGIFLYFSNFLTLVVVVVVLYRLR